VGQGHEIRVAIPVRTLTKADGAKLKSAFEKTYGTVYGLTIPGQTAEAISFSVTVSSRVKRPAVARTISSRSAGKPLREKSIFDAATGRMADASVYWRFDLQPGMKLKGPAIIAEHETSTIVGAGFSAHLDSMGNIVMERRT
jgi:N-methylhydantoinase A